MLSAITYNVQYGKKLKQIEQWLSSNFLELDILCFQEFPYLNVYEFLENIRMNTFAFSFATGFTKQERDFGQVIAYNKKRIKFIEERSLNLPHTSFIEDRLFKNKGNRSALFTTLEFNSKKFTLINTHLLTLVHNKIRKNQISAIINKITESEKKDPVILLGDFNYTSLFRQNKFLDYMNDHLFNNAHTMATCRLFFLKHQTDYILYKNCKISYTNCVKVCFSDHYPVYFTINF